MKRIQFLLTLGLLVVGLSAFTSIKAQVANQYHINGIAINGYDPVAFFRQGMALKGDSTIIMNWNGATWYFSNTENRKLFEEKPEMYAPQYGGYCAFGASKGYKAKTDPTAWTIVKGKLYLNYNSKVKEAWLPDTTARIQAADQYWNSITTKVNNQ